MIAIIDYGVGNLFSLQASLNFLGLENIITADEERLAAAGHIILPGVGAFADAAEKLRRIGLDKLLISQARQGKPLLGICLGMQLLFEKSYEYGEHRGLGLLKGEIVPFAGRISERIPHMGWNSIRLLREDSLLEGMDGDHFYFVHSYFAEHCEDSLLAVADYGVEVPAFVRSGNIIGAQGHPEKSGEAGLRFLRAFAAL